jgi:hypothetical protein
MERPSSVGTTPGEFEFPCTQHEDIDFEEEEEGCSEEEPPVLLRLRCRDPAAAISCSSCSTVDDLPSVLLFKSQAMTVYWYGE